MFPKTRLSIFRNSMNRCNLQSDLELLAAIKEGDDYAFDELYNRYWQPLLQHAANILPTLADAEEVVQDLFIKIWRTRESLEIDNVGSYLHAGVRNGALSVHRTLLNKKKYKAYGSIFLASFSESIESSIFEAEKRDLLEKALAKLPALSQEMIRLKFIEGLTFKDISVKLNCSTKTVEYQLDKSKRQLKTAMQRLMVFAIMLLS